MEPSARVQMFGDVEHCDFVELRDWLAGQAASSSKDAVELVLLCQSRPGQFSQRDVEDLHRRFPLATLLGVFGTWCQGEQRSGYPWHGIDRVYSYNALPRISSLLAHPSFAVRTQT